MTIELTEVSKIHQFVQRNSWQRTDHKVLVRVWIRRRRPISESRSDIVQCAAVYLFFKRPQNRSPHLERRYQ